MSCTVDHDMYGAVGASTSTKGFAELTKLPSHDSFSVTGFP